MSLALLPPMADLAAANLPSIVLVEVLFSSFCDKRNDESRKGVRSLAG